MFAPHSEITCVTPSSCPGLSSSAIVSRQLRPSRCKPRVMTRLKMFTSMLPPEIRQQTFLPAIGSLPNMAAATVTAPAPSATSFCFSISARIAAAISSSLTVTTSSTYLRTMSSVISPGCLTAMPSANVRTLSSVMASPASSERFMLGAFSACTPYTFTLGFSDLMAHATPEISPPPPMEQTTASTSGS